MLQTDRQTGVPSIDKPWLKYYDVDAEEKANNIPNDKTVWDVIEERLKQYIDIPALEFFGKSISRTEFINNVYVWARAFKQLGIQENDVIPYYGVFTPDVCEMIFALNILGACPYFLKLAINSQALAEETKDSKFAIVFDQMWANVQAEFSKERFQKIIIVKVTDSMPAPKKQIVSVLSGLKNKVKIPKDNRFISVPETKKLAYAYPGEVKATFVPNRAAFITSSSGTTVDGVVKGTVATNESTISQLYMGENSKINYFPGDRCLNHFPPTASTSLNVLFFLALYKGETVVIDPRVTEEDFYKQVTTLKPNIVLTTGSSWEAFFNRVETEINKGKKFNFNYSKGWVVGGEGTVPTKFLKWDKIMERSNAYNLMFSGYGSSELFSATTCETLDARYDYSKPIMSVGIPYAGIIMGVFDTSGKELTYNSRGELWIKSKSAMKEYYNKPELTAQVKTDGWIHTGDLAEIDENGFVYIWGRVKDVVSLPSGREVYMFDVSNVIKRFQYVDDAIVLPVIDNSKELRIVAHIVWNKEMVDIDKVKCLKELNEAVSSYDKEIDIYAYAFHEVMLPYSPTTLKKDKNRMSKQKDGYYQVFEGNLREISLS